MLIKHGEKVINFNFWVSFNIITLFTNYVLCFNLTSIIILTLSLRYTVKLLSRSTKQVLIILFIKNFKIINKIFDESFFLRYTNQYIVYMFFLIISS